MYNLELKPFKMRDPIWQRHTDWDREFEKFFDVFSKADNFAPACFPL